MKSIQIIVGTRPEAIKMAPVYKALKRNQQLNVKLVSTGQHKELMHQALASFGLLPDIDLDVMRPHQSLSQLTSRILCGLEEVFKTSPADLILGHGDTTTCYATALSAFYHKTPFFHVEAGLRTYNLESPFPEEFNRQNIAQFATHHFAPTNLEKSQLANEGIPDTKITVTGTTVHDAITEMQESARTFSISEIFPQLETAKQLAVITLHRRETGKDHLRNIMQGIRAAAENNLDTKFLFPVHPNPQTFEAAQSVFQDIQNVILSPPLTYANFLAALMKSDIVITDSGGVQEEASYFGKPVLILRDKTERRDGLENGTTKVIGTDSITIQRKIEEHLKAIIIDSSSFTTTVPRTRASDIIANVVTQSCFV